MLDIVERVGAVDGEAYQDDVGFRVCKGPQSLVVLLAGGIPKSQLNRLAVYSTVGDVVFEDGGDLRSRISAVSRLERHFCAKLT